MADTFLKVSMHTGSAVLDFLLPARCGNCGTKVNGHGFLCPVCWGDLKPLAAPFCDVCALPFEFDIGAGSICGACLKDPPVYDRARAAVQYDDLGRSMVMRLKHGTNLPLVPVMGRMMAQALEGQVFDRIMPVPLHKTRLLKRRFNQSQLLAKDLSNRLGVLLDCFSLKKKRATVTQGGLNRKQRFRNVAASFAVVQSRKRGVKGLDILLVDDVLTTGATVSAAAIALKRAGARSVGVVAFARVGKPVSG